MVHLAPVVSCTPVRPPTDPHLPPPIAPPCPWYVRFGSGDDVEALCRVGLSALGRPAVVLFADPKEAARAMTEAVPSVEGGSSELNRRERTSAPHEGAVESEGKRKL